MASEAVMVTPLPANRALFIAFAGGGGRQLMQKVKQTTAKRFQD